MIELIFTPVDWFTHFEMITLGRTIESGLDVLGDVGVKAGLWERELNLVLAACRTLSKTNEGAFALLRVAETAARKGFMDKASDLVEEACGYLKSRNDQKAILEWILGALEWQLRKHVSGFNHWKNSHAIYDELVMNSTKDKKEDQANWYKSCLKKLDGCMGDLVFSVNGGYLLLNRFSKSRLTPVSANMVQAIRKELSKKRPEHRTSGEADQIRMMVSMLEKSTLFSEESPEALIECGLMCMEIGNPQDILNGMRYLRLAEAKYNSDPDNMVVVYWLLGAAQWGNEGMNQAALDSWRTCQEKIKFLTADADKDKNRPKLEWYKMLGELIDRSLKRRVEQRNGQAS